MNPTPFPLRPDEVMGADFGRLRARRQRLDAERAAADDPRRVALEAAIAASIARRAARAASVPAITLDASLPISGEAERIVELIRRHPVLVVAGETGSGKTTQLPKLCLAAGRGIGGLIGCTQPRRIAARSVARRVAQELRTQVGELVGFQVRFTEQVGERALVKFMTDGILLAETQSDPQLAAYDTLIIDEAHERSLNIDFLLGYLKRLLDRRPDLRVIVTSATIDTERFAAHFGGAPVVSVEGRSFPVEVRWHEAVAQDAASKPGPGSSSPPGQRRSATSRRENEPDPFSDPWSGVVEAVDAITRVDPLGDVLVFLPGEREIRDVHLALERRRYRETEVLPLYARLSARDQDRVFNPGPKRRLVLATNVAETSLTVPRIRHVVDPGLARVNRFSHRNKVQRLHVEKISQASADQRKGRCGRVGPGTCWRLYDEADFLARPRYTDPELLRSSLAGVILRLASLGLGPIESFPFLDPPNERAIADGYQQLVELAALSPDRRALTPVGRILARLPIDVKLARMLVEAQRLSCLRELTVLAAFLSAQDPRERPPEAREAADRAHALHADPRSDFIGVLNLWEAYRAAHEELSQSKLRDWCQSRFLSFLRLREWRELHRQLLLQTQELGWRLNAEPASYEAIHRALLSGLPGQVARKDEKGQYQGTRGRRYLPFPGSALAKSAPQWMLSAVLLDTQRLYGLTNARVEPQWIEQQAQHLLKHRYYDPHWSQAQGHVQAYEQVSLFGLVLVEKRRVAYQRIDPVDARRIFLREALATGAIDCRAGFVRRNREVLAAAHAEEAKRRRSGLLRSEEELAAWFETRIPADVASAAGLDAWVQGLDPAQRRGLEWTLADVMAADAAPGHQFPATLDLPGARLALRYRFEPGHAEDGVAIDLPLAFLNALPDARLGWLVPGLLQEKVAEWIRALPKGLRRNFVPAPDFARAFAEAVPPDERALGVALSAWLEKATGVAVAPEAWDEAALPPHLRFHVRLLDEQGAVLESGRDLAALRAQHGLRARQAFARETAASISRSGLTQWDFEALPAVVSTDAGLTAYPALVAEDGSVAIRVYEREDEAALAHAQGVTALLRRVLADKLRAARKQLPLAPKAAIAYTAVDSPERLREDLVESAFEALLRERAATVRVRAAFDALAAELGRQLFPEAVRRLAVAEEILVLYGGLAPKLAPPLMGYAGANFDDLRAQLARLVQPGFARAWPLERLAQFPRYLKAMALRVERLQQDARRDQARMLQAQEFERALDAAPAAPAAARERLRWAIEEFRVQLFAQELGTREPVSEKRLRKLVDEL
ncbi:MAG TPA: ATP-dependent RNA helicase HrpA [Pseudomonadota bacterium]|nr:ATP-dependent RNA helicase HrpA [Pseudomonadota bacterium]